MAERRMFAKTIIDSDAFLDMPLSTQVLYFHLAMRADDDGFVNNPRKIQRMIGAADDDMKLLIAKSFLIPFESGIVVIKHWKIHNYIQKDRYKETVYKEERALLDEKENRAYTLSLPGVIEADTECIQDVYMLDTQDRLDKSSLAKERESIDYQGIIALYNTLCPSLPSVKALSEARRKAIKARMNSYTLDDFKNLFEKAEASDFLKGKNVRNWTADFDWLIKDANMVKVLEDKYNRERGGENGSGGQADDGITGKVGTWL